MPSDSSDGDHDVHSMDYQDCVDEEDNQNVGLVVDDFEFSRGDKGRITTIHSNPRVLQDDPYQTLSKKTNNANKELDGLVKYKTLQTEF